MEKNDIYESIVTGLKEAIDYEKGSLKKKVKTKIISIEPIPDYHAKQIKRIREKLNLTQVVFAKIIGVSVKTVEAWEAGKNKPNGPAQRILDLLKKDERFLEKHNILKVS